MTTRIFDFRSHVQHLLRRPSFHEPALDGVRALAVMWVVMFHSVYYHLGSLRQETGAILKGAHTPTPWLSRGDLGVDLFFVLSGFLMGTILLKEWQKTGSIAMPRFYARRFLRLIPVYVVVMIMGLYFLRNVPVTAIRMEMPPSGYAENMWANLLYVNNFLPRAIQYMPWCWSLAIEEQFYLVLPIALLVFLGPGRGRIWLIVGAMGLSVIVRVAIMRTYHLYPPFADTPDMRSWHLRYDVLYDKPWSRFGGLLAGVAGAYLSVVHPEKLRQFFSRTRVVAVLVLTALVLMLHIACVGWASALFKMVPPWVAQLWWALHRDVFSLATVFIMLSALLAPQVLGGRLRGFLAWKGFYPIAQLSYSIYLFHEMLCLWLFPKIAPTLASNIGGYSTLVLDSLVGLILTVGVTALLYITVERPCMELRSLPVVRDLGNRRTQPALSPAG